MLVRSKALIGLVALSVIPTFALANGEIIGMVQAGKGRVANAVVSLEGVPGNFSGGTAQMDQKDKEFVPSVLPIVKGTTVKFVNSDPFFHNVFSSSRMKAFNVSQEKVGDSSSVLFDKVGIVPIRCHIHASMKAYIIVLPNPYFAVTNSNGLFRISNVPAGTYTIKVWSEHGAPQSQTVQVPDSGEAKVIFKS